MDFRPYSRSIGATACHGLYTLVFFQYQQSRPWLAAGARGAASESRRNALAAVWPAAGRGRSSCVLVACPLTSSLFAVLVFARLRRRPLFAR